ncbi:flagellar biosynthetic protein FliO [Bacillus badius]|uniref:flagellar biosynthetic protein FliO n=1 Tax=Bacillus badius TaxID=1455 RepID=UPI001CBE1923|nr:flagellar biosynthetic protein FliO [Bacillus badius]UAT31828.1 flagellar biosynthetic protein FliO [Bacillus badius]
MIRQLFKPFAFILFTMALFAGNVSVAQAEPFDNNVKDCLQSPEKCGQQKEQPKKEKQGSQNQQLEAEKTVGVTIWDFVKMIGALIFVLALIYSLLRFVNQKSRSYQQSKLIQHLGGTPLGGNRSIQMVKVGDRILIVGVGENIELLKEINDETELARFVDHYNNQAEQMLQPQDIVTRLMNKRKGKEEGDNEKQDPFKQILAGKLSELKQSRQQAISKMNNREKKQDE